MRKENTSPRQMAGEKPNLLAKCLSATRIEELWGHGNLVPIKSHPPCCPANLSNLAADILTEPTN